VLATRSAVPVVPVAHNAGEFWPRNAFLKRPGEIIVSVGPPIETEGRDPVEVNAQVEAWIEGEMHQRFPHHYGDEQRRC
jgi:1-acyl-sn-glycerol-3-phosphate acyltransferase